MRARINTCKVSGWVTKKVWFSKIVLPTNFIHFSSAVNWHGVMWKLSSFNAGSMVLCSAIWRQFHLQHLQRMACVAGGVERQKVVQHNVNYPCTVCTQPCKINSYHSGSLIQSSTMTNYHCDGIPCQHSRKFRTAESLGTQLMPSWRFSNHARPTFGVGRGYSNSVWQRVGMNSYFERTGVSGMWTEKVFVRRISNGLMADSVAANSLLLRTVRCPQLL